MVGVNVVELYRVISNLLTLKGKIFVDGTEVVIVIEDVKVVQEHIGYHENILLDIL